MSSCSAAVRRFVPLAFEAHRTRHIPGPIVSKQDRRRIRQNAVGGGVSEHRCVKSAHLEGVHRDAPGEPREEQRRQPQDLSARALVTTLVT
jgi:hypothetical protein